MKFAKKNIIAHRGLWNSKGIEYKNSKKAIFYAINSGFGIETDLRFFNGRIIISHDQILLDSSKCNLFYLDELLDYFVSKKSEAYLALNIKEDGIGSYLKDVLKIYPIDNYFIFDMSNPELIALNKFFFNIYVRESEYENSLLFKSLNPKGVWLDSFGQGIDYYEKIEKLDSFFQKIAVVSPELHGKPYIPFWLKLKENLFNNGKFMLEKVMICTDYPDEFYNFINEIK